MHAADPSRTLRISVGMAVNMLAKGYYEHLANMTRERMLTAEELKANVDGHGHTLIEPPPAALDELRFDLVAEVPRTYETSFRLWTTDEGRSRFTARFRLVQRREDDYLLEVLGFSDK